MSTLGQLDWQRQVDRESNTYWEAASHIVVGTESLVWRLRQEISGNRIVWVYDHDEGLPGFLPNADPDLKKLMTRVEEAQRHMLNEIPEAAEETKTVEVRAEWSVLLRELAEIETFLQKNDCHYRALFVSCARDELERLRGKVLSVRNRQLGDLLQEQKTLKAKIESRDNELKVLRHKLAMVEQEKSLEQG